MVCTMEAASLRLHSSTFAAEIWSDNSATFFLESWSLLRHKQAGPGTMKSRPHCSFRLGSADACSDTNILKMWLLYVPPILKLRGLHFAYRAYLCVLWPNAKNLSL
jgi:hypothetical protein